VKRVACLALAAPLVLAGALAAAAAAQERGDPAARMPAAEHASEVWELTLALDDGHWIVAQATVHNLGPEDGTGGVSGHVIEPDGRAHEFHKFQRRGGWTLSEDRRALDFGAIVLDQRGAHVRLHVDKRRVDFDLRFPVEGGPAWSEALTGPSYAFDLLALAAPVSGVLQIEDGPVKRVSGRAVLTHRWMSALEPSLVGRRVELFGMGEAGGVYLQELTTPAGETRRWLVAAQGGRILGSAGDVRVAEAPAGSGLVIESSFGSGRIGPQSVLLRDEPLQRVPWLLRWWLERLTRPRFVWSAAPFEFVAEGPGEEAALRVSGRGLVNVARFDPQGEEGQGEEGRGEEGAEAEEGGGPAAAAPADPWGER